MKAILRFSTIQYNTTVKPSGLGYSLKWCFSTIQYNTTVKPASWSNDLAGVSVPFNITLL